MANVKIVKIEKEFLLINLYIA